MHVAVFTGFGHLNFQAFGFLIEFIAKRAVFSENWGYFGVGNKKLPAARLQTSKNIEMRFHFFKNKNKFY